MTRLRHLIALLIHGERRQLPRDPEAQLLMERQDRIAANLSRIERIRLDARLAERRLL